MVLIVAFACSAQIQSVQSRRPVPDQGQITPSPVSGAPYSFDSENSKISSSPVPRSAAALPSLETSTVGAADGLGQRIAGTPTAIPVAPPGVEHWPWTTESSGRQRLPATPPPVPTPAYTADDAVRLAKQDLSRRINVPFERINLVSVESVVWPDTGLGVPEGRRNLLRVQLAVPGFNIILAVDGQQYEYHAGGYGRLIIIHN